MLEAETAYANITRPLACIDLDALDRNIEYVNTKAQGKAVRIATKSVRSIGLLRYIAERLVNHSGFMTFDLRERHYLLGKGLDDLLLGCPLFEKESIEKIIPFIKKGRTVTFMIDCIEQWVWLEETGKNHGVILDVCIDVNLSTDFKVIYFGTTRSSLHTAMDVERLLASGGSFIYTKITGVMGYEAQIAGVTDRPVAKWQAIVVKQLKNLSCRIRGPSLRVTGAGHTFSGVALPDNNSMTLDYLRGLISYDSEAMEAKLWAGTYLYEAAPLLESVGMAFENMGDVQAQTIAGAISTGAHGTGITLGSLSNQVVACTWVDGMGTINHHRRENDDLSKALSISLGLLGVLVDVTLKTIPLYSLWVESTRQSFSDALLEWSSDIQTNRHMEWFYFPGTNKVQVK